MKQEVESWVQNQMATVIKFMGRKLVKWKRMKKSKDSDSKTLLILILKLNKQHVLSYFSTYKLRINIL